MPSVTLTLLAFWSFSPGVGEMVLIFLVVLVLFGPKRLPSMARLIGQTLEQLRRASQDFRDQIMRLEDEARKAADDVSAERDEDTGPDVCSAPPTLPPTEATGADVSGHEPPATGQGKTTHDPAG